MYVYIYVCICACMNVLINSFQFPIRSLLNYKKKQITNTEMHPQKQQSLKIFPILRNIPFVELVNTIYKIYIYGYICL